MGILDKIKKKKDEAPASHAAPSEAHLDKTHDHATVPASGAHTVVSAPHVLLYPVVSEKAALGESSGTYTFVVDRSANKIQVKQAVKELYHVMPRHVRMVNVEGKRARFGKFIGKRSEWKKAIVTLPEGKTISIHEGV